MANELKVSVISPCYNHGRYLCEMMDSVLSQTLQCFELIIVDDGSTDGTRDILDRLRHEKLRVIHTAHSGPAAARNTAIAAARAPIILNLDADDRIAPTLLEKACGLFDNPEIGIINSEVRFFGARTGRFELPPYSLSAMLADNVIHSTAFFRKEDWQKSGGYSDDLIYGLEDYDFWLSLIELGRKVYRIPEELIFYRTYRKTGDCRSGRLKRNRKQTILTQLTIFRRHEDLFRTSTEAHGRMTLLKEKWDREPAGIRRMKQIYCGLRSRYRAMLENT